MKIIKNINQISTKKGDLGKSKNYSNEEFYKSDLLFNTLGDMDELSSSLGMAYHHTTYKEEIKDIQRDLQDINSIIATTNKQVITAFDINNIIKLESLEKALLEGSEILPVFILPGSDTTIEGSYFDMSRSIARRAERSLVRYFLENKREELILPMKYLNRLSDLLFIFARSFA
jgi:cob(I)alamin adenosyltransferase